MRIAVRDADDDCFGEIWELSDDYEQHFLDLFTNERNDEIYKLLKEEGDLIIDKCDYWINIGER